MQTTNYYYLKNIDSMDIENCDQRLSDPEFSK